MAWSLAQAWADSSIAHAVVWYLGLLGLGLSGWLILRDRMQDWQDSGYAVSRHAGLLVPALALWMAAHVVPVFTSGGVALSALALAGAALWTWRRAPAGAARRTIPFRSALAAEMRFAVPFAGYLAMRGLNGDIIGLEKFMDFAFLNSALHSAWMPPPDPWFSGHGINYYYFGHYMAAFLCRLTGTPPQIGYNLMLATVFAATFQLAWALVAELARALAPPARTLAATAAAFWITMGGNLHGFFYGLVRPVLVSWGLAAAPGQPFLISDPTRFVGYNPPRPDKLITEFPAYGFYVGDLHAHLSNLPNVLLFLCVVLAWLRARTAGPAPAARPWLAAAGALIGVSAACNSWDAAIHGVLLGGLLVHQLVTRLPAGWPAIRGVVGDGVVAAVATALVAGVFLLHFRVPGDGIGLVQANTPLWQWLILYGEQAGLTVAVLGLAWRHRAVPERTTLLGFGAAGLACVLAPEVIYIRDIYGSEYHRANTAFKFGLQGFLLLTTCAGVCIALLLQRAVRANIRRGAIMLALQVALVPPLSYSWFVVAGALGPWRERSWSLDGWRHLARQPDDLQVIRWLLANRRTGDVLVEAVGESFTYAARISTHTAVPAPLGWPVHEQLWRNSDPKVQARRNAVERLYAAREVDEVRRLAQRLDVRWIVVGELEQSLHPGLDSDVLSAAGTVVFRAGRSFVVEMPASPRHADGRASGG